MSIRGLGFAAFPDTVGSASIADSDRMFRLADGRLATIPYHDSFITIFDPDGPDHPEHTKFGETSLEPFQSEPTVSGTGSTLPQLVVHSPSTNEVYRISYTNNITGTGPATTAHFYWEVAVFDFTAETVTFTDYGIGPRHVLLASWSTLFRQMWYGMSFRGCAGGKIFLGRADTSSSGTNYDCVVIDTAAQTASVLNNVYTHGTQDQAFTGQMREANDGKLYGPASNYALVIDPSGPTFTTTNFGGLLPASHGFGGGLGFDSDGRLYATPTWSTGGEILVIDPSGTTVLTDLGLSSSDLAYKGSAAQGSDGLMTLLPRNGTTDLPSDSDYSVVRFDPDTLVGSVVMASDRLMQLIGPYAADDGIMDGELAFHHAATGDRIFRYGFRDQVGATPVDPPPRTGNPGNTGIVCRRHRPLRSDPFLLYNTENWDGGWVLENEGTAGNDMDIYLYATENSGIWELNGSYRDIGFTDDHMGGPLYGEPCTVMFVMGTIDTDISSTSEFEFQTDNGLTTNTQHTINSGEFSGAAWTSISLQIVSTPDDTLVTLAGDRQQGGGNSVIDETWYANHSDANVTSTVVSMHPFLGLGGVSPTDPLEIVRLKFTIGGLSALPTPLTPWPGPRIIALFRGQVVPADIPGWKTFFGL